MIKKRCIHCDEVKPLSEFHRDNSKRDGHRSYCKACAARYHCERRLRLRGNASPSPHPFSQKREKHPAWKGGRITTPHGYVRLYLPDHPRVNSSGYVYEHIVVVEHKLRRVLLPGEVVHHIDGDRGNNHPDNLVVFPNNAAHLRFHRCNRRQQEKP